MIPYNTFVSGMVVRQAPREGEDDKSGGTGGQGGGASPPPTPNPQPPAGGGDVTFTEVQQAKVNKLVAEEKRKAQEASKQLVTELETRKQAQGTTEQEKAALQARIDELTTSFTTKEEMAKTEFQRLQKKYDADVKAKDDAVNAWRSRYDTKLKTIDLREAAAHYNAMRAEQVEKLLWDQTVVEEQLDESGKPTGEFVTMVNFLGKDKDGKTIKLKLSPRDAVKAMTEMPEEYGNLFESKARGGVGQQPNQGAGGNGAIPNIETMTPQDWNKYRAKIKEQMARQG